MEALENVQNFLTQILNEKERILLKKKVSHNILRRALLFELKKSRDFMS